MIETDIQSFREIVKNGGAPKEKKLEYTIVENESEIIDMLDDLKGCVSFDIETTCLYPWDEDAKVRAIGFGTKRHQWCIYTDDWSKGQLKRIIRKIDKRLRNCVIAAQNGKFDSLWMRVHFDVRWNIDFDTMLAHYMLDENSRHGLKYLATAYLGAPDYDIKAQTAEREPLCKYLALDLLYTRKLRFIFGKMLNKEPIVKEVYEKILMPCARLFVGTEYNGVFINTDKMDDAEVYLRGELAQAKEKLDEYATENPIPSKVGEMNWGSPQQVAYLLFEEFGLDVVERTKKGAASTSESVLKRIDHPLVESLLRYRGAKQQLSFFIEGWKPYLVDSKLHPSFKLHGTVTGRFSCENPNLQQVPRDTRIRSLITAPPGWVFVEADLSQIEMRIAAELSGCKNLLDAFYTGVDVHWKTAIREIARGAGKAELVMDTAAKYLEPGKPAGPLDVKRNLTYSDGIDLLMEMGHGKAISINKDWKEVRKKAKAINFGFLFGMWYKKFMIYARDNYGIKVSEAEAKAAYDAYFDLYPELKDWHKRQQNYARRNGYVMSLSGRKRRLPLAMSDIEKEYKPAMRQGINSPVQSFANELNLMAAIEIRDEFDWDELRIVGTVHDSTLMWIRKNRIRSIVPRILEIMSHPKLLDEMDIKIRVPLEADVAIGPWGEGVSLKQWLSKSVKAA
jgi:DNA polymerase-1